MDPLQLTSLRDVCFVDIVNNFTFFGFQVKSALQFSRVLHSFQSTKKIYFLHVSNSIMHCKLYITKRLNSLMHCIFASVGVPCVSDIFGLTLFLTCFGKQYSQTKIQRWAHAALPASWRGLNQRGRHGQAVALVRFDHFGYNPSEDNAKKKVMHQNGFEN